MLRCVSASMLLLAAFAAVPAAAALDIKAAQPQLAPEPPEDMIDFLGRRRECSKLAPEPGEVLPPPPVGSWEEWLRCEALPAEEEALRRRYKGHSFATGLLNQPPGDFHFDRIFIESYHGPLPADVQQVEQRGVDSSGRVPWRMVLDDKAAGGRATAITVSWGNHPSRTIYLDNRTFPWLDLKSAWVALGEAPDEHLMLVMRYGARRGWCGAREEDDRSRVSIHFTLQRIEVFRNDRTNCNIESDDLKPDAFTKPPPVQSR